MAQKSRVSLVWFVAGMLVAGAGAGGVAWLARTVPTMPQAQIQATIPNPVVSSSTPNLAPPVMPAASLTADLSRPPMQGPVNPEGAAHDLSIPDTAAVDDLWSAGTAFFKAKRMPEASAYFWAGASKGEARGASALGAMFIRGQGVPQDYKQGVFWLTKAANAGNRGAQYTLATLYDQGVGVQQDPEHAARLFRQSAEQRHAAAAKALAVDYELGRGVPRDRQQAIVWMQQSASDGDAEAPIFVAVLIRPDTPQFMAEQQLVAYVESRRAPPPVPQVAGGNFVTGAPASAAVQPTYAQPQPSFAQAPQRQKQLASAARPRREKVPRRAADVRAYGATAALLQQSMGFGGIFGGMLSGGGGSPFGGSSGGGASEADECGRYTEYAACQAHRNGDEWAADRIQDDRADGAERDWYDQ